ncbi:MAG: riboflavin synthase [Acidobacteriota bacterium]
MSARPRPTAGGGLRLEIAPGAGLDGRLPIGASVSVAGVCLTVAEAGAQSVTLELSPETLARTTLGDLVEGDIVNLEPALRLGDALGGHWVQGHVDGTVEVLATVALGDQREVAFSLPEDLQAFMVEKGSVTIDGVSLTVAHCDTDRFSVALIPHTLEITTLGSLVVGQRVNLEIDILSKYVHQALASRGAK